jgi:hypothetical protein
VPDDLEGIVACFSPGVSTVAGFELDCARLGMDVFLADASVDFPPENHPRFHFLKKFIGAVTRENFIAFSDWVQACATSERGEFLLRSSCSRIRACTFIPTTSPARSKWETLNCRKWRSSLSIGMTASTSPPSRRHSLTRWIETTPTGRR